MLLRKVMRTMYYAFITGKKGEFKYSLKNNMLYATSLDTGYKSVLSGDNSDKKWAYWKKVMVEGEEYEN